VRGERGLMYSIKPYGLAENRPVNVVMKRTYFVTVTDGVFCVGGACDKRTRNVFQPSRLTGVRLVGSYNTLVTGRLHFLT